MIQYWLSVGPECASVVASLHLQTVEVQIWQPSLLRSVKGEMGLPVQGSHSGQDCVIMNETCKCTFVCRGYCVLCL